MIFYLRSGIIILHEQLEVTFRFVFQNAGETHIWDFRNLRFCREDIPLILDIVSLEQATKKGRCHVSVEIYRGGWACDPAWAVVDTSIPGSNAARLKESDPEEWNKAGEMWCPFAIRSVARQSAGFPNLDEARISVKATLESLEGASGVFHMTKRRHLLSICMSGSRWFWRNLETRLFWPLHDQ